MSRYSRDNRILAGLGVVAVVASLVIGGTTSSQSRGSSWDVTTDVASQATGHDDYRGTSWD